MCSCRAPGPKAVYTVPELADLTGLTRQQVGRLLAKHQVTVERLGRRILVPLSCLRSALPHLFESMVEARALAS